MYVALDLDLQYKVFECCEKDMVENPSVGQRLHFTAKNSWLNQRTYSNWN